MDFMDGKEVWKLKKQGEITVFLSLCLLSVAALICVMVEGARSAGSRVYLQIAANGSLDTLFGQYHRELWKKYRLFGVEYQKMSGVERQLESYVNRYQEVENWYPIRLQTLTVTSQKTLGSQGGDRMMGEILDYMKYGIWEQLLISPEKGEDFWNDIKEAAAAGGMTDTYEGQSVQVKQVERAVERLADCVEDQEKLAGEIALALDQDDVEGFEQAAKRFQKENSKMDGLFRAYEKSAQKLERFWTMENRNWIRRQRICRKTGRCFSGSRWTHSGLMWILMESGIARSRARWNYQQPMESGYGKRRRS